MSSEYEFSDEDDPKRLKFRLVTTKEPDRIVMTVDLFGGEERLMRMSHKVVDLQVENFEELMNDMGYFKTVN